jgi:Tfp pilus assembly protein PilO
MAIKNPNLSVVLAQFYQKPVAQVSSQLVFSIVAVIVFAVFAIRPTLLTMSDLIKELDDKQALNQALTQKVAALSSAQTEYTNSQDRLFILDEAIPPNPRFGEAVAIVEKIASENSLLIETIQAKTVPKEDSTATGSAEKTRLSTPIVVTVQGDYPKIRRFVTELQNTRRLLVIDSVIFNVSDTRSQKVLRAIITINIQYFGSVK